MEITVYKIPLSKITLLKDILFQEGFRGPYTKILIKPNVCGFYPPSHLLMKAVVDYFGRVSQKIVLVETESTMYRPMNRFRELSYIKLFESNPKVEFLDLTDFDVIKVNVPKSRALRKIPVSRIVFEAPLVNVAVAGTHPSTRVTIALKNLFGLVSARYKYLRYHPLGMDKVVADVAKVIKPALNIVEVPEAVLVSEDTLAVDIVASREIGVDPLEVKHFHYVAEDRGYSLENYIKLVKITVK
ncbi:MAG TPA: DUF362 domain-containing protein [Thermoprotei archaeon]|nr:DUF362 domain-containing protein [Thermoprotei archaeon]